MELYGPQPTRVMRPLWLVNELELDCEVVPIDFMASDHPGPAYRAINPSGKVPALVDGDLTLTESVAIMLHLAETRGGSHLLPSEPAERARMHQWNSFLVTEIEQPLWRMALHEVIYPEADRRPEEIDRAARDARRMLPVLEAHLEGRDHLVGSGLTVADFNAAYTLDWADAAGLLDDFPNCRRFVERMYARPKAPPRIAEAFAWPQDQGNPPRLRADLTAAQGVH